jgi:hypothetical protein
MCARCTRHAGDAEEKTSVIVCSYALGCNATAHSSGGSCAERFKTDWIDVYKTHHSPAIQHLRWCAPVSILDPTKETHDQVLR